MELLVQTGARYDIEIIDDVLYVYNNKSFEFDSVHEMQEATWLIEALGEKFARRVDRYADSATGDRLANEISHQGKVLYRRAVFLQTYMNLSRRTKETYLTVFMFGVLLIAAMIFIFVRVLIDMYL